MKRPHAHYVRFAASPLSRTSLRLSCGLRPGSSLRPRGGAVSTLRTAGRVLTRWSNSPRSRRTHAVGQAHHPRPRWRDQPRQRPVHQVAGRMAADPGEPRGDRAAEPRGLSRRHRHQPVGDRPRPLRHGNAERNPRQDAQGAGAGGRAVRRRVLLPALGGFAVRMPQAEDRACCGRSASATAST